jgi:hypothetical protein
MKKKEVTRYDAWGIRSARDDEQKRILGIIDDMWKEYEKLQPRDLAAYQRILKRLKREINK